MKKLYKNTVGTKKTFFSANRASERLSNYAGLHPLLSVLLFVYIMFDENILSDYNPKSKDGKDLIPILSSLLESFQYNFNMKFDDMQNKFFDQLKERDAKVMTLENEITGLKNDIQKLEDKIEENESYERRDTVILSGSKLPAYTSIENTPILVRDLLKKNLDVNIATDEISTAHRLGGKSPGGTSIIVKFCRRNTKNDLISASRTAKPTDFFINECLTPQRQTISYVLRRAKREFPNLISGSNSFDGKVYVWVKPPNPNAPGAKDLRHAINNHARLLDFCNKTLEKPLSHFIKEWTH